MQKVICKIAYYLKPVKPTEGLQKRNTYFQTITVYQKNINHLMVKKMPHPLKSFPTIQIKLREGVRGDMLLLLRLVGLKNNIKTHHQHKNRCLLNQRYHFNHIPKENNDK